MQLWEALVLGLVQGVTEFLPVSSSGHLVLFQSLFGVTEEIVFFDLFLHFCTLLAVCIYFWKQIIALDFKQAKIIFFSIIPVGIVGLLFKDQLYVLFSSVLFVGFALLGTGVLNLIASRKLSHKNQTVQELTIKNGLFVGLMQVLALMPGISRSATTVTAGLLKNLSRKQAFEFSFLLSIPLILGANLVQLIDFLEQPVIELNMLFVVLGGIIAFASGLISLRLLEYMMLKAHFAYFAYYCFIVGLVTILFSL